MGRPKKGNSKSDRFGLRIGSDETALLEKIMSRTGKSKSDIIREGIRMMHDSTFHGDRTDDFEYFDTLNDDL